METAKRNFGVVHSQPLPLLTGLRAVGVLLLIELP